MDLSIVIPAFNEIESLPHLLKEVETVCAGMSPGYEIIVVDDGSGDGTFSWIEEQTKSHPNLKGLRLQHNCGKAAALSSGFKVAKGAYIITMDADLQDNPAEIPGIVEMLRSGADMVSGWKKKRHDPPQKTLPSKLFNFVTRVISGVKIHDFNCGLKGYRREVVKSIKLYGELHRYIPVLAHWKAFRVEEKIVDHRPRKHGRSKYGMARLSNGLFDLLTLLFLHRYNSRPLHLFGFMGLCFSGFGLAILAYFAFIWAVTGALNMRPLLLGGFVSLLLGFQVVSLGLLAELITHQFASEPPVAQTVGMDN